MGACCRQPYFPGGESQIKCQKAKPESQIKCQVQIKCRAISLKLLGLESHD